MDEQLYQVRRDSALVEQYGYDNNANRTSTLTTSATYDDQDRLIQQGGVAYTFDDDGYLTSRGSDTFTYSARGELLSATVGSQTNTYQYDGMGRRIGKTDAAGVVQYLYGNAGNSFQVTASRDAAGVLTNYFYDTAGNLFSFERSGQRYYVATDQLGTPKAVTDATGTVVNVVEYDAWGVKLSDTNPTFDLPVGFAGGIADGATGLVRFGFRDYEPGTGRWTARDPVLFRGGQANLYVYLGNDGINSRDISGLSTLVFNPWAHSLTLIGGTGNVIGTYIAYNNVDSKSKGPWPTGVFGIEPKNSYKEHPESDENGSYGSLGIFKFVVKNRSDMGVHAGRANKGGPKNPTMGCIRTTEAAMEDIYNTHFGGDELTEIIVLPNY